MSINKKILVVLSLSCQLFGIARYKAVPLTNLDSKYVQGDISFSCYSFTKDDCKKYLGREDILYKGYQPIQITLINNSKDVVVFDKDRFNLHCVDYNIVADSVSFDTKKRLLGWGLGSFFVPILIIPFFIEAVESPKANIALYSDYAAKSLDNVLVQPACSVNGLIFVSRDLFQGELNFSLKNLQGNDFKLHVEGLSKPSLGQKYEKAVKGSRIKINK